MHYTIHRAQHPPPLTTDWSDSAWSTAGIADINHFHPRSGTHRPLTQARLLADDRALYLQFRVEDRYVRSVRTRFLDNVCQDSCVEFFVRPGMSGPYFNFEINAGGTLLASCIRDWRRMSSGFADCSRMTPEQGAKVQIVSSLPRVIEPEMSEPVVWSLSARIPLSVMEDDVGRLSTAPGTQWQGNFYKCAGECSHPHWGSWSPIGEELNFHQPACFGSLTFADKANPAPLAETRS